MIPDKVQAVLDDHGLRAIEFEEGATPTVELAAKALGVAPGSIAKSLLFKGKDDRYRLVVCAGDRKVSNSLLKRIVGIKTRMANAEETRRLTGYEPGGVCPFALGGTVAILLDQSLADWDTIYPAAGTNASGVPMTFEQLRTITGGVLVEVTMRGPAADRC